MALLGVLSFGTGSGGQDVATPSYQVTDVKRKLFREEPAPEVKLTKWPGCATGYWSASVAVRSTNRAMISR